MTLAKTCRYLLAGAAYLTFTNATNATPWLSPGGSAATALEQAQEAYLARDYSTMTKAVRDAMLASDADTVVSQHVGQLLAKAYADNDGKLPADWRLPAGVSGMKLKVNRRDNGDGIRFNVSLEAEIKEADLVKELRLTRYPDQVILDRQAGVGNWKVTPTNEGVYDLELTSPHGSTPLANGLYLLHLELKDGSRTDGWFIADELGSTSSPKVLRPSYGETFTSSNPELIWHDFWSSAYQADEKRRLAIYISPLDADANAPSIWDFSISNPTITRAVVGRMTQATGATHLADGNYWVSIGYFESHQFGDIRLIRASRTGRPFSVKTR